MADIIFEIQGQDAVAATEELLSNSGLTGDWKVAVEDKRTEEPVTTTVATIVGIVGGTLAIAEQIRKWYEEYKKGKAGKTIKAVMIVGRNRQHLWLENATIEQIQKILEE
jgi:inorganic pyrophosphatase